MTHKNGPGLRKISDRTWWGPGYCGICSGTPLPISVRWWDPDDGWRMGVLCKGCGEEARDRGPQKGDYALVGKDTEIQEAKIDINASLGDLDSAYTESKDD